MVPPSSPGRAHPGNVKLIASWQSALQTPSGPRQWKLRLERVPSSTDKQFTGPVVSSIAVGFTMLSPLVCLIAVYLWARVVG